MPSRSSVRVARRFLDSTLRTAVVAHVDALGNTWGWFADEVRRMHLVPMVPKYRDAARVWLEDAGIRCFQVDHVNSGLNLDLDQLHESVSRTRDTIESAWLRSCERRGWLSYSARHAAIALYFGTPTQLVRKLNESSYAPEFLQLDVHTNAAGIEVRVNRLIWRGADDGSDAKSR
jgi:hypothetical protein